MNLRPCDQWRPIHKEFYARWSFALQRSCCDWKLPDSEVVDLRVFPPINMHNEYTATSISTFQARLSLCSQTNRQITQFICGDRWFCGALPSEQKKPRKKEKKRKTPKCVDVRRSVWNAVWENAWPKTTEANSALRLAWPAPKKHELRRQRPRQRQEIAEHAPQKCGLTLAETNTIPPPRKKKKNPEMSLFISCGDLCGNVIWWRRIWPNGIWALERHTIPYTCGKGSSRLL